MPWSEVSPGLFQRPIGENEKFIKAIGDRAHAAGREHWSITSKAKFKIASPQAASDISKKCRRAWQSLRFEHPSIASTAEEDVLSYIVPDSSSLEKWMSETFTIHEQEISADDVIASMKPSRYVTAHYLPETCEIILHFAHWRTDGFGALQLIDAFCDHLCREINGGGSELPWGEEVGRLVPCIEEVLDLPHTPTPDIVAATSKYMATLAHIKGAVGVACKADPSTPPGGTRSAGLRLPESTTTAIADACKARGISILSAVHASVAAVTYSAADPSSQHKHYTSTMRFSLRPHLPEPYGTRCFASALYTGGYMFAVPASQSWTDNAEQYNAEYKSGITDEFLQARRQYALEVQKMMQKNLPPPSPPPSEVDISSVDDAEQLVSPVHGGENVALVVEGLSIGVETLTRQMYCFVWTFRGQLEFNLVYNEAFYDAAFATQLVGRLSQVLETELGVPQVN